MSANDKLAATFGPGRTTPTPTLETRIAEVLAPRLFAEGRDAWNPKWEEVNPKIRDAWIALAREHAAALAPVIAEAWDEGYKVGDTDRWAKSQDRQFENDNTANPYRSNDE